MRDCRGTPLAAVSMDSRSAGEIFWDNRASRLASDDRWSGSRLPMAIRSSSRPKDIVGSGSSEYESDISVSVTPTASTMTKRSLFTRVRRDGVELRGRDDTHAAALHLLEEVAALHVPHEEHDLHGLDVRPGGNHVHGDHNARVEPSPKVPDQLLGGMFPECGGTPLDMGGMRIQRLYPLLAINAVVRSTK